VTPSITSAEAKALGRRAAQPVKGPGELLAVFVPGKLVNTKNARLHYMAESRYKRGWRERTTLAVFEADLWRQSQSTFFPGWDHTPKRITFAARTHGKLDSDGLQVSLAPVRDAMIQCGVIHDDGPDSGHVFDYLPSVIDRANRGVTIRVSLRPTPTPGGAGA